MRLSEERIEFIADQLVNVMIKKKLVRYRGMSYQFRHNIYQVIFHDLKTEDKIDAEVERTIRSMKRNIPEGSAEWNSIFYEKKLELANKKNYIL